MTSKKKRKTPKSTPEPSPKWFTAANDPRPVTAGFIDYTNEPSPLNRSMTEYLSVIDAKLKAPQTRRQRLILYREIIARGDLGEGYALGFTDDDQAQEFNCEELAAEMDLRLKIERGRKAGTLRQKQKKAATLSRIHNKWTEIRGKKPEAPTKEIRADVMEALGLSESTIKHVRGLK